MRAAKLLMSSGNKVIKDRLKKQTKSAAEKDGAKPTKKKPIQFMRKEEGVKVIKYHAHWGWITKLKYIEDLQSVLSSSLDGFIHMHDLDSFNYRRKTFNLHQKGINSFVYSTKHRFVASCGEERHIILWEPHTL